MESEPENRSSPITQVLLRIRGGEPRAAAELLPLLYEELHRIAGRHMERERGAHTLQATALVHEAYLRLFGGRAPDFEDRKHFLAAASRAMRHVLVDHARARGAQKSGAGHAHVPLDETLAGYERSGIDVLAVHEGLEELGRKDPELVQIVEMHFFSGLTLKEVADSVGLSERTVHARWSLARAWLREKLGK